MREPLKSVGQVLGGIGLFVGAVTFALQTRSQNAVRDRELKGIFLLLGSELASHYEKLLKVETEHPIPASSKTLDTRIWTEHEVTIAQWLTLPDYNTLSRHYTDIGTLARTVQTSDGHDESDEELREQMQACLERLPYVQALVQRYAMQFAAREPSYK